jgi:glucosylceramidase
MHDTTWIATTQTSQWQSNDAVTTSLASESKWDVEAQLDKPLQTIDGFGACFNELGWTSLSALDFSRDWYSYDETPEDFALAHFSISNDLETLIPFIKNALRYQPELKHWASAWSPFPTPKRGKNGAARRPSLPK